MHSKFRISIATKLIAATIIMMVATVLYIAHDNAQLAHDKFSDYEREANETFANQKAVEVEGVFLQYVEKIRVVTNVLLQDFADEEQRKHALDLVFTRDLDLVNIEIYQMKNGHPELYRRETNELPLKSYDLDASFIPRLRREKPFPIIDLFADKDAIQIHNSSVPKGMPLLTIGVAFADMNGFVRHVAIADVRLDRLQKGFLAKGARTFYLVDRSGSVIADSDEKLALEGKNLANVPIVKFALSSGANEGERRFMDPGHGRVFGAYAKTAFGPIVVVQVPESIILEPAAMLRRSAYVKTSYAVWIALFFVFVFAYTLTGPIEKLHEVALQIARGNFNVHASVRTHDEVADLAEGFNQMVVGLKERDKVKNILTKFHGSSITEDLIKGDLQLGGSKKDVTVFFSDIRDFTKFSEGHTPEQVVEMLNEYFEIMVAIITARGGIVDKFVGDAILAVWGAPKSSGDDRGNAIMASLEMRQALALLNERRIERGETPIKIGMGLHAGLAISGNIGSMERMEYTVIGDAVNTASRVESSTKSFGADLLVSETVADGMDHRYVLELAGSAEVKGKSEPIKLYKVRGYVDAGGQTKTIQTAYSDYEPADDDKVKVAG